jgi:hypothetical protein
LRPGGPLLSPAAFLPGRRVHRRRPARLSPIDATGLLAETPGSFVYDFGTPGWPDGWSARGLSPQRVSLRWNDLPFDDPLTGRPRYDLLPLAFLRPLHVGAGAEGAPTGVHTRTMPYDTPRPLTELRYRTGGGLQSIMALHAQQRKIGLLGRRGRLQVVAGYGGHAGGAAYKGSRLRRMRQTYLRARYRQSAWSVTLSNLHNRRHLGAQGGARPQGALSTIFTTDPGLVPVRNESAERQTIRNDLRLGARARFLEGLPPPSAVLYWTSQIYRYRHPLPDSVSVARTDRYGLRLTQRLRAGRHHLRLRLDARTDYLDDSNVFADSLTSRERRLTVAARDSAALGPLRLALTGRMHSNAHLPLLTGRLHTRLDLGAVAPFLDLRRAGQPASFTDRYGFGTLLEAPAGGNDLPTTRLHTARLGVSMRWGALDATLFGFAQQIARPWDYVATGGVETLNLAYPTTVAVRSDSGSVWRAGATLRLGLRRRAERGFYLTAQPTFVQPLMPQASPLANRLANSRPLLFGHARLGARYALFERDLDLDVYLRGRFWTAMRSRGLHPATALLTLLPDEARRFGPSGTLDLHVRGNVRGATIFVSYQNALSGTALPGTLLVPVYPLPARRLRFGIFWPISG